MNEKLLDTLYSFDILDTLDTLDKVDSEPHGNPLFMPVSSVSKHTFFGF